MTKSDRLSRFVIHRDRNWTSSKHFALGIIKEMRGNLVDQLELHAYGKNNVRLSEDVSFLLQKWIQVLDIETGFTTIDK